MLTEDQIIAEAQLIERFAKLFAGYTLAHGYYPDVSEVVPDDNGKRAVAVNERGMAHRPVTLESYTKHLLDKKGNGLGIVMLGDDGQTCLFGVIDVDNYKSATMHAELERKIGDCKLPLIVCRSKSGGAHLFAFFKKPVLATLVQQRLEEWRVRLGLTKAIAGKDAEVFPKQTARREGETGNWINLPYHRSAKTDRYAFRDGVKLNIGEFIEYAESKRITLAELEVPGTVQRQQRDTVDTEAPEHDPGDPKKMLWEAPPCLVQIYAQGGLVEGVGNDGMTAVAVYLKKRYPDTWQDLMPEVQQVLCQRTAAGIARCRSQGPYKGLRQQGLPLPVQAITHTRGVPERGLRKATFRHPRPTGCRQR